MRASMGVGFRSLGSGLRDLGSKLHSVLQETHSQAVRWCFGVLTAWRQSYHIAQVPSMQRLRRSV